MPDFQRLRELLLSEEQAHLAQLQTQLTQWQVRLDNLEQAQERAQRKAAERFPQQLITTFQHDDGPVATALVQPLSRSLAEAVRQQPQSIVDALFPVIGPAIRRAIAEAMRDLSDSLNQVMESSLTPRGLRWRMEAWRSGVPYAQVALRHAMRFHIDHVFLIEPRSGLVLHHEAAPDLPPIDADAVAGMLSAIKDFVRDSVARESSSTLNSATVGEHVLWLLEGPKANLACFIRGVPPHALQTLLEQRLEQWHGRLDASGPSLQIGAAEYAQKFSIAELTRTVAAKNNDTGAAPSANWPAKILLLLLVLGIAIYWWRGAHWQTRIDALRSSLSTHAGFVLTGIEVKRYSEVHIHGLLDPIAEPLQDIIANADLGAAHVELDTQPFVSAAAPLVLKRAQNLLHPPSEVKLDLDHGVLKLSGVATPEWVAQVRERAPWIAGIDAIDASQVSAPDNSAALRSELDSLLMTIAGMRVHLLLAKTAPDPAYSDEIKTLANQLQRALALATQLHLDAHIRVYGLTDGTGDDTINRVLREYRAQWLLEQLSTAGIPPDRLTTSDIPDTLPHTQRLMRAAAVQLAFGQGAAHE